ncbi:hypothetical protein Scep_014453 [Stephania cephalantha]|uniref:Uncharacterized protein n=1 Tax=Stephania cephalantha TaxID=152367 RepID=A0AAP0J106_9MAGN
MICNDGRGVVMHYMHLELRCSMLTYIAPIQKSDFFFVDFLFLSGYLLLIVKTMFLVVL